MKKIFEIEIEGLLARLVPDDDGTKMVLLKDEKILGSLYLVSKSEYELLEIEKIFTPYPRKGYGSIMLEATKVFARQNNYKGIVARTFPEFENFFRKNNFKKSPLSEGLPEYYFSFR